MPDTGTPERDDRSAAPSQTTGKPSQRLSVGKKVGGPDPRVLSEMRRLQQRVRGLEHELDRIRAENDALNEEARILMAVDVPEREPARLAHELSRSALSSPSHHSIGNSTEEPPDVRTRRTVDPIEVIQGIKPLHRIQVMFSQGDRDLDELVRLLDALVELYDRSYWISRYPELGTAVLSPRSRWTPPHPQIARISQDSPLIIELVAASALLSASAAAFMRAALGVMKHFTDHPDAAKTLGAVLPELAIGWNQAQRQLRELGGEMAIEELSPPDSNQ